MATMPHNTAAAACLPGSPPCGPAASLYMTPTGCPALAEVLQSQPVFQGQLVERVVLTLDFTARGRAPGAAKDQPLRARVTHEKTDARKTDDVARQADGDTQHLVRVRARWQGGGCRRDGD